LRIIKPPSIRTDSTTERELSSACRRNGNIPLRKLAALD